MIKIKYRIDDGENWLKYRWFVRYLPTFWFSSSRAFLSTWLTLYSLRVLSRSYRSSPEEESSWSISPSLSFSSKRRLSLSPFSLSISLCLSKTIQRWIIRVTKRNAVEKSSTYNSDNLMLLWSTSSCAVTYLACSTTESFSKENKNNKNL